MNNNFRIQKLRDRRHKVMNYRQILINRFDNIDLKTTLSEFYQKMESYEVRCAIYTLKKVLNRGN